MKLNANKLIAVGIVLIAVVPNAAISDQNTLKLMQNEQRVSHIHQVLTEIESTISTLKDAETEQRDYIITGKVDYLKPDFTATSHTIKTVYTQEITPNYSHS